MIESPDGGNPPEEQAVRIRRAGDGDVADFARGMNQVHGEGFLGPEEDASVANIEERVESGVRDPEWTYLIAEYGGDLIGAIVVYVDEDLDAHSFGLWVLSCGREKGTGRALLEAGLSEVPKDSEVVIEVWPDNLIAIELFEKSGFEKSGLTETVYTRVGGAKSRALLMRRVPEGDVPEPTESPETEPAVARGA
jgi:ribosomal protein S18 acetylase RimI-like enzyme